MTKHKITGQGDLFLPNPTDEQLSSFAGADIPIRTRSRDLDNCVQLLSAPHWNVEDERWEALANVAGALCLVELNVTATEDS